MSTLPNDGSVSGDPCHNGCGGQLVLRSPGNGYFLGCSNYRRDDAFENCKFKMAPNSVLEEELKIERREKRQKAKIVKGAKKALKSNLFSRGKPTGRPTSIVFNNINSVMWAYNRPDLTGIIGIKPGTGNDHKIVKLSIQDTEGLLIKETITWGHS